MQIISYIKYFWYLASNWDFTIAAHILKQEPKGERKYGIQTTGFDKLDSLIEKGVDIDHSTIYMPASYDLLEDIFQKANINQFKHFVDLGCGKGRALCVAAAMGVSKLTGVELSKEFCESSKRNLEIIKQKFPSISYQIKHNDAFYFDIPDDADCIFMFNPFDDLIMSGVIENIEQSLAEYPRDITIIYFNPMQQHLFLEQDYKLVHHQQWKTYLEASILQKSPGIGQG